VPSPRVLPVLAAVLLMPFVRPARSGDRAPTPDGPEFQVNTHTAYSQQPEGLAAGDAGDLVVVWASWGQDGSGYGVFGRRYDPAGIPVGGEFQVNTDTPFSQRNAAVSIAAAGGFVVVWEDHRSEDGTFSQVRGQLYDPQGDPLGAEFQASTSTTTYHRSPAVSTAAGGNFVVVWSEKDGPPGAYDGVFGRRFDSDGNPLGAAFQVSTYTTSSQRTGAVGEAVAVDGVGRFVVVWMSYGQDGSGFGVFGRRYDAAGSPLGGEFQVNTYSTGSQIDPSVATDLAGNFTVAWSSYQDGSSYGIFGRRYDAEGEPLGNEFQVNEYTTGGQKTPSIASDGGGDFVIAWTNYGMQDGSSWGVFGRLYDSMGDPLGGEFQVNSYTTGGQAFPSVAMAGSGSSFSVVWASDGQDGSGAGVFGQRYRGTLFADGFESGDTSAWSSTVP